MSIDPRQRQAPPRRENPIAARKTVSTEGKTHQATVYPWKGLVFAAALTTFTTIIVGELWSWGKKGLVGRRALKAKEAADAELALANPHPPGDPAGVRPGGHFNLPTPENIMMGTSPLHHSGFARPVMPQNPQYPGAYPQYPGPGFSPPILGDVSSPEGRMGHLEKRLERLERMTQGVPQQGNTG